MINKLNYSNDLESCAADWAILLCLFFFVLYKEEKIKKKLGILPKGCNVCYPLPLVSYQ
jgi:hypothetical protein